MFNTAEYDSGESETLGSVLIKTEAGNISKKEIGFLKQCKTVQIPEHGEIEANFTI